MAWHPFKGTSAIENAQGRSHDYTVAMEIGERLHKHLQVPIEKSTNFRQEAKEEMQLQHRQHWQTESASECTR